MPSCRSGRASSALDKHLYSLNYLACGLGNLLAAAIHFALGLGPFKAPREDGMAGLAVNAQRLTPAAGKAVTPNGNVRSTTSRIEHSPKMQ